MSAPCPPVGCPRCWRGCRPGRRGSGHHPSGHTQTGPGQRCHKEVGLTGTREQSGMRDYCYHPVSDITVLTLKVTLPLASLSSFCRLSMDWLATLIPLISLISSPTWRVAWKYLCQYFAHTQKVNLSASPNRKHNVLKIQERAQMRNTSR